MPRILMLAVLGFSLAGSGPAFADDDNCGSPMSQWQPQDAAVQHAAGLGIQVSRLKIDDGCYEIKGRDEGGNRIEIKLDPGSLALMELEVKFPPGSDPERYLKGARAPEPMNGKAPADNPMFDKGGKPEVDED